ncbi:MAG: hypothetical protein ACYTBZ_16230 [Planctomycetota bacterium]
MLLRTIDLQKRRCFAYSPFCSAWFLVTLCGRSDQNNLPAFRPQVLDLRLDDHTERGYRRGGDRREVDCQSLLRMHEFVQHSARPYFASAHLKVVKRGDCLPFFHG